MIDNDVIGIGTRGSDRIDLPSARFGPSGLARTHANVLEDHIVRVDPDAAANKGDARTRRRLSGNGHEGFVDANRFAVQIDHAADLEDDDPGPLGAHGPGKGLGAIGVEVRHSNDASASSAGRIGGPSHRIREGLARQRLRLAGRMTHQASDPDAENDQALSFHGSASS